MLPHAHRSGRSSWTIVGAEHLAMARMARCTTRFARRGGGRTLARLLVGRVRRWPMGGGRILVETGLQCGDTLLEGMELREVFLHWTQIRLDCGGRVLPVPGVKRERASGAVGGRRPIHHISQLLQEVFTGVFLPEQHAGVQGHLPTAVGGEPVSHSQHPQGTSRRAMCVLYRYPRDRLQ